MTSKKAPSAKDEHIKQLQNLLAAEKARADIYEKQIRVYRDALAEIIDVAEGAL